jgi:hypothetical protein
MTQNPFYEPPSAILERIHFFLRENIKMETVVTPQIQAKLDHARATIMSSDYDTIAAQFNTIMALEPRESPYWLPKSLRGNVLRALSMKYPCKLNVMDVLSVTWSKEKRVGDVESQLWIPCILFVRELIDAYNSPSSTITVSVNKQRDVLTTVAEFVMAMMLSPREKIDTVLWMCVSEAECDSRNRTSWFNQNGEPCLDWLDDYGAINVKKTKSEILFERADNIKKKIIFMSEADMQNKPRIIQYDLLVMDEYTLFRPITTIFTAPRISNPFMFIKHGIKCIAIKN